MLGSWQSFTVGQRVWPVGTAELGWLKKFAKNYKLKRFKKFNLEIKKNSKKSILGNFFV